MSHLNSYRIIMKVEIQNSRLLPLRISSSVGRLSLMVSTSITKGRPRRVGEAAGVSVERTVERFSTLSSAGVSQVSVLAGCRLETAAFFGDVSVVWNVSTDDTGCEASQRVSVTSEEDDTGACSTGDWGCRLSIHRIPPPATTADATPATQYFRPVRPTPDIRRKLFHAAGR